MEKITALAYTMQETPNLDKPLPRISIVVYRFFRAVQISDKVKQLRLGPFKIIKKPADVAYDFSAPDKKQHFVHIETICSHTIQNKLCFLLIFSHTMNRFL